jgi:hypothetical protein
VQDVRSRAEWAADAGCDARRTDRRHPLGAPLGVLGLAATGVLKNGPHSAGVARQAGARSGKTRRGLTSRGASPRGVGSTRPAPSLTTRSVGRHALGRWLHTHLVTTVVLSAVGSSGLLPIQNSPAGTVTHMGSPCGGDQYGLPAPKFPLSIRLNAVAAAIRRRSIALRRSSVPITLPSILVQPVQRSGMDLSNPCWSRCVNLAATITWFPDRCRAADFRLAHARGHDLHGSPPRQGHRASAGVHHPVGGDRKNPRP